MKRLTLLLLALGLLAAACGSKGASSLGTAPPGTPGSPTPTGTTPPTTTPSPTVTPTSTPPPTSADQTFTFEVWFNYAGKLFVTQRTKPFTPAVGQAALDELLTGPSQPEGSATVDTSIPDGISSDITALEGTLATVNLSPEFYDGSTASVRLREAQVVYTLTQYSTIGSVQFTKLDANVANPLGREDFEDLLPPILVETPVVGEQISNPVTIAGTADVFEAAVSVRILDENGNEIARTFTTATCGTGCRGDYSVSVAYTVNHEQVGSIEVLDYSAKDGSAENVIRIPVTLTP